MRASCQTERLASILRHAFNGDDPFQASGDSVESAEHTRAACSTPAKSAEHQQQD